MLLVVLCPAASLHSRVLQGPFACVPILAVCLHTVHGSSSLVLCSRTGRIPTLAACPYTVSSLHPGCVSLYCP